MTSARYVRPAISPREAHPSTPDWLPRGLGAPAPLRPPRSEAELALERDIQEVLYRYGSHNPLGEAAALIDGPLAELLVKVGYRKAPDGT